MDKFIFAQEISQNGKVIRMPQESREWKKNLWEKMIKR